MTKCAACNRQIDLISPNTNVITIEVTRISTGEIFYVPACGDHCVQLLHNYINRVRDLEQVSTTKHTTHEDPFDGQ